MTLKDKAKKLPKKCGVYLFLDKNKQTLYVGRAVNLKRRVQSYFSPNLEPRIKEMIGKAKELKCIKTDNLLEAIILEANLIKKHWPKYNIKDKDNRSFVYLAISKDDFPKLVIIRERELKKIPRANYVFGPFQSAKLLKNSLKIIRSVFPYSNCAPNQGRPCFYRQINLCPGVCAGEISKKEYQKNIKNIILLFKGEKRHLMLKLKKENPLSALALKHIQDVSLLEKDEALTNPDFRIEAYDISHLSGKEVYGAMTVFNNGEPDKKEYRLFKIKQDKNNDLENLAEIVSRRFKHKEWQFPRLILIDGGRPQINYIANTLEKLHIKIPLVGISKYSNDKLVFSKNTTANFKNLANSIKKDLLLARNEAHRFSLKASRRKRQKTARTV